jgi:D-alanyl-D-alanine carboxypeptidase
MNIDDIPEARRDRLAVKSPPSQLPVLPIAIGAAFLGVAGLLGFFLLRFVAATPPKSTPKVVLQPSPTAERVDNVLGHLRYQEAPASELQAITPDGRLRLRVAAAEKFRKMQADALADGVTLLPISGFRSIAEQNSLFFGVKEQRNQPTSRRAEVSAPPERSEHHTGYAIDIGDGRVSAANLKPSFENTPAFYWLKNNANRYSFEMSFPRDNPQGISYEPWHWRYVGDRQSLETFYEARSLKKINAKPVTNNNP